MHKFNAFLLGDYPAITGMKHGTGLNHDCWINTD